MNYTIAFLQECHGGATVYYGKDGNEYIVSIQDRDSCTYRHRKIKEQDEAVKVFLALAEAVCKGLYSFENRVNILMGDEIK